MDHSKVTYKKDMVNKVVIAEIEDIQFDAFKKINKNFVSTVTSKIHLIPVSDSTEYLMPYKMKAVARCVDGDKFNYEKGKQIALRKLDEKYENAVNKRIARFLMDMNSVLTEIDKYFVNKKF